MLVFLEIITHSPLHINITDLIMFVAKTWFIYNILDTQLTRTIFHQYFQEWDCPNME